MPVTKKNARALAEITKTLKVLQKRMISDDNKLREKRRQYRALKRRIEGAS
jgi:hypothetical protein